MLEDTADRTQATELLPHPDPQRMRQYRRGGSGTKSVAWPPGGLFAGAGLSSERYTSEPGG